MRRFHLIITFIAVFAVAVYLIYFKLRGNGDNSSANTVFQYMHEKVHSPMFCGEEIPLDKEKVRNKLKAELSILIHYESSTNKLIKRANYWFPKFSKILKKHQLPEDLKYLAVIESHMSNVVSPAGAKGFWQFMRVTGKRMGLEINHEVDERFHPMKSTVAACRYFQYAYKELNNWANVMASYNLGIAGIQRKLKRQNKTSYFDLKLNRETARYVYKAMAFKEIYENSANYKFPKSKKVQSYPRYREIKVTENIPNLITFAEEKGTKYHILVEYNPWIIGTSLTQKSTAKHYILRLPPKEETSQSE